MELKLLTVLLIGVLVLTAVLAFSLTQAAQERAALRVDLALSIATTDRTLASLQNALRLGEEALALCGGAGASAPQPNREQAGNNP